MVSSNRCYCRIKLREPLCFEATIHCFGYLKSFIKHYAGMSSSELLMGYVASLHLIRTRIRMGEALGIKIFYQILYFGELSSL